MEKYTGNNSEAIRRIVALAENLETSDSEAFIKENLPIFFEQIQSTLGVQITDDVNALYEYINHEDCLVRVERITRIIKALEAGEDFEIGEGDSHYANAVIPDPEGIKLAFAEGQAPGPVRLAFGFGKTIVGFKTDKLEVGEVDYVPDDVRDVEKRAYLCRHVDGKLSKEDIKAVVMRIPKKLMQEILLTNEEKKRNSPFVFRGFSLGQIH